MLLKRYTTLKELVIKNTLEKKNIFVLMEGFHLCERQISLQKQPLEGF